MIKKEKKIRISNLPKPKRGQEVKLELEHIRKSFKVGKRRVKVLKGISTKFYQGEMVIVYGPSGCGKSTMLHTLLGLEEPDEGKVYLNGKCLFYLDEDGRAVWRRSQVGIIFQQSNWIKSLNVWENVAYPLFLTSLPESVIYERAIAALATAGMERMQGKRPMDLSGGEQQKVQLARALISNPEIIVADEPTGNLDSKSSRSLIALLVKLNRELGKTIIMVTHDESFLPLATRIIRMRDGRIVEDRHD